MSAKLTADALIAGLVEKIRAVHVAERMEYDGDDGNMMKAVSAAGVDLDDFIGLNTQELIDALSTPAPGEADEAVSMKIVREAINRIVPRSQSGLKQRLIYTIEQDSLYLTRPASAPEWIACSERLPETDDSVLTCDNSGHVSVNGANRVRHLWKSGFEFLIHWMPLPPAPAAKEGEKWASHASGHLLNRWQI